MSAHARPVFTGSGYVVGEFRCPPEAELWREVNWIGEQPHLVLPSTAVAITAAGAEPFVATANEMLFYDPDVHFRRDLISEQGDHCWFVEIGSELAAELELDDPCRKPGLRHLPLPAPLYAQGRLHWTDEGVLDLLAQTAQRLKPARRRLSQRQQRAVEELKAMLAAPGHRALKLADYAATVHYSPYALARMFRAHTGYPIMGFKQQLRVRESLAEVLAHKDLSVVAAEHGFSSHSHYTSVFRRTFGFTPSQVRSGQVLLT